MEEQREGYSCMFYVMLLVGIGGVVGFVITLVGAGG